jgi:hypothetical protein
MRWRPSGSPQQSFSQDLDYWLSTEESTLGNAISSGTKRSIPCKFGIDGEVDAPEDFSFDAKRPAERRPGYLAMRGPADDGNLDLRSFGYQPWAWWIFHDTD